MAGDIRTLDDSKGVQAEIGRGSWRTDGTRDYGVIPFIGSVRSRSQRSSCVESRRDGVVTVRECQSTPRSQHDDRRQSVRGKKNRWRILFESITNDLAPLSDTLGLAASGGWQEGEKKDIDVSRCGECSHPLAWRTFLSEKRVQLQPCVHRGPRYPWPVHQ